MLGVQTNQAGAMASQETRLLQRFRQIPSYAGPILVDAPAQTGDLAQKVEGLSDVRCVTSRQQRKWLVEKCGSRCSSRQSAHSCRWPSQQRDANS